MRVGDKFPVAIAGQTVAQAEVREIGEGQVVLVVPGTVVVMATRTQIDVPEQVRDTTGTQTVITDVERTSGDSGPVVDNQGGDNNSGDNTQSTPDSSNQNTSGSGAQQEQGEPVQQTDGNSTAAETQEVAPVEQVDTAGGNPDA